MNTETTKIPSTLLRNKLATLAIRLQQQADPRGANPNFNTLEKIATEAIEILSSFYKDLSEPGYVPVSLIADTVPDPEDFNKNFQAIKDDLEVIFAEFENLEGVILGNFNYMVTRLNRLNRKLKSISSLAGDFILYSQLPLKDAFYFQDSFNNFNRAEIESPLLNESQCEINQVEGIVTLPIDRETMKPINIEELPVLNSNSNGAIGNNYETGAPINGNIATILDNNVDTWFEYERVVATDDGLSLILDFTVNLGERKIINFIRINPNNFGTKTQARIVNIDTSTNGSDFVSIKDDIPIADFVVEDEDNIFILAPSSSKYAGQGLFSFTAREAKYIRITLEQTTPYIIDTASGEQFRYALGVRDIEVQAVTYKPKGEFVSVEYQTFDDVRKVLLLSNQNPDAASVSSLVSIEHFISPDNGVSWHQIRPKVSAGLIAADQTIPEILDFNGVSVDSVITTNDIKTLRYKAIMTRNTDAFVNDAAELAQLVANHTELHGAPSTTPFELTLQNRPIDDSIKLIDPNVGSRGKENVKYYIASGDGSELSIILPFVPLVRDKQKVLNGSVYELQDLDPQTIYVNGIEWDRGLLTGSNNRYRLNFEEGKLTFGDGTDGNAVPNKAIVSMTLTEERIFPGRGTNHIAHLQYPVARDQGRIEISRVSPLSTKTKTLDKGIYRHTLDPDITSGTVISSDSVVFSNEITLTSWDFDTMNAGDYAVDYTNGVLYNKTPTSRITPTTVTYDYNKRTYLSDDEWSFASSEDAVNGISITNDAFQTFTADTMDLPADATYFNFAHLGVVKGTVVFLDANSSTPTSLNQEVEFIDGRTELEGAIATTQALATITASVPQLVSIPFAVKVTPDLGYAVTFSNTTAFSTEVNDTPNSAGEYRIRRHIGHTGVIEVYVNGTVSAPGNVNYYFQDYQVNLQGRYSINYETGEAYFYEVPGSDITVQYEYTDYRIKYDIARLIPDDDWSHDTTTNKITIKDREILRSAQIPQSSIFGSGGKQYQISYQYVEKPRDNIGDLEPYFTPVLKDYALKIVTKSRLT